MKKRNKCNQCGGSLSVGGTKRNYYRCNKCEAVRAKDWYKRNRPRVLQQMKMERDILRREIIDAYGGKCVCCGETEWRFLTIDHIDGGGTKHREEVGRGWNFFRFLKRNGLPQNEYQLLCFNCNCAKGKHGVCPHEEARHGERTIYLEAV